VKTIVEALAAIAAASPEERQYCLKVLARVSWRTLWRLADDEEKQRQLAGTLRDVGFVLMRSGTSRFLGGEPLLSPTEDGGTEATTPDA
jgi:hypothetical protein